MPNRRVVISGLGVVSPYGIGAGAYWQGISSGRSAARLIDSFDVSHQPTRFAAQTPLSNSELGAQVSDQKTLKTLSRSGMMAIIAAQEARADAGTDFGLDDPFRMGTSIGAGGVGLWDSDHSDRLLDVLLSAVDKDTGTLNRSKAWENVSRKIHPLTPLRGLSNVPTAQIAIMANARGNCQTITTACTSSAQAIGEAFRQVKSGIVDVIFTGGHDSMINPYGMISFNMLGVMSTNNDEWQTAARPFDRRRDGFMLGEGAAIFILEEMAHCQKRGGKIYAEVIGFCSTNDAFRLTDEPPEAWGSIAAMRGAIADAGIYAEEIDYVNVHGTGTKMNDSTETRAIKTVLGPRALQVPVSSTKSMIGHLVAAAGAIEFAACALAIQHQIVPPTINLRERDPNCDLDYVPNMARPHPLRVVLSNSFGFGGQNACLLLKGVDG